MNDLRGWMYFSGSITTALGAVFLTWGETPPKNVYIILAVLCAVIANSINSQRAYIDQSISRKRALDAAEETSPEKKDVVQ